MTISFPSNFFVDATSPTYSVSQIFSSLAQQSARPNFEIRFFQAQNTAVERFNKEIAAFQTTDFGKSKTALLRIKAKQLSAALDLGVSFKKYAVSNRQTVKDTLDQLSELRALADPATVTEFDAKRTEVLATIEKLMTANVTGLGAPDGLVDLKPQATTDIEGIVHNNFATAADITAAQNTIDSLTTQFSAKLDILEINQDIATTIVDNKNRVISEVNSKIDDIEIAEQKQQIDRIKKLQDDLARTFSGISLAFEGSQFLTDFVNQGAVQDQTIDPGSVLNLFA